MLFGVAIGSLVNNVLLALILAFLSHYFLDLLPHIEYPVDNIVNRNWKKSAPDFLKVFLDFILGILLIFLLSKKYLIFYVYAGLAILPDASSLINLIFENKTLENHAKLHQTKIHFLKYKKISTFWRICSQVLVAIISVLLLLR